MKINYILSDRTKTATTKALSQVILRAEKNLFSNFIVIVPETKSIIIEKELLSLSKTGAFANIFVYSFVRLLNRLDFIDKDKIISKQTAVMLLRKIVYDNFERLKCYKKTAKNINFAEKIYETLQQFKSSEISADYLKQSLTSCDDALKAKLSDIIIIFEEYEKLLGDKLYDDCDKLNLLKKFAKISDFIKNSEVFVVGFDNITSEMVSVLEEIAKNAKEITFSSVYFSEKRADKFIQNNELFLKFKRVSDNLKYPYIPTVAKSYNKGDFYSIANNLYVPNIKRLNYNGDIKIYSAPQKDQEIQFVASKIIELLKKGVRLKDIGVLSLDIENDKNVIKKVFDNFNINYFINQEIDISSHFLVVFIKLCFELYISHLSSDKIIKFLKSQFITCPDVFDFENFVNENGFEFNDFIKPLSKEFKDKYDKFEEFSQILYDFQKFYVIFAEKIKNSSTVSDFVNIINFILEYFNVKAKLSEIADYYEKINKREESAVCQVIFSKTEEFMKMFCNFLGETKMSVEEFLQVFLSGFGALKINLVPVSIDCIVIQNNTDGFFDIKYMFIIGASEDNFPKILQDSGIILDEEIEKISTDIKKVEPTIKDINAREKFIAYESLLEPSEKLFISYSRQGWDGSQKKPSYVIKNLIKIFGEEIFINNFVKEKLISKKDYQRDFAKHIFEFFNGSYSISEIEKEFNILKDEIGVQFANYLLDRCKSNPKFEIENASDLYFSNDITSSSQLEKYFSCPYSFFVQYGLRLKENKKAKLSKLDVGVILHKVAELFVKNIRIFINLDDKMINKKIDEFIENIFIKLNLKKSSNLAIIKFLFQESKRLCEFLLFEQKNSNFKAKYNEFAFYGESAPVLNLDKKTIRLEGKIDRIDEFGEYIRIIDYKTGDIESDLYSIYYGKKIQLISYLSAVSKVINKKIAGLFYLPIHSDYVKNLNKINEKYKMNGFLLNDIDVIKNMDNTLSFESPKSSFVPISIKSNDDVKNRNSFEFSRVGQKFLTEKEFNLLKKYNEELLTKASSEILTGYIEPSPLKKGKERDSMPCLWCDFAGFCGLEKARFSKGRSCEKNIDIDTFKTED